MKSRVVSCLSVLVLLTSCDSGQSSMEEEDTLRVDTRVATGDTAATDAGANCDFIEAYDDACSVDEDCGLVFHQIDCCGSQAALGIDSEQVTQFNETEAACVDPALCDCIPSPTNTQDGNAGSHEHIEVACLGGQCRSRISPSICEGIPEDFSKSCSQNSDCFIAFHQTNCCGTRIAVGLSITEQGAFSAREGACQGTYPGCGCASEPTVAEDGKSGPEVNMGVTCLTSASGGLCQTHLDL